MKNCPVCNEQMKDNAVFCENCGNRFEEKPQPLFCAKCGKELAAEAKFCNGCGTPVKQAEKAVTPPQQDVMAQNTANTYVQPESVIPPTQQAVPQQFENVPVKKKGSPIVPIILIILIIAVICFDVFYLFKEQIFGKKDNTQTNCSVVSICDDYII